MSDFVGLLVRDDAAAVRGNAPESVDAAMAWMNLIDIIDRYECIEIQSAISEVVRADAGERLLRVTIHGRATTATLTSREIDILPNVWYLKAVPTPNGWQLAEVMTAERRLANAMIAAATVDEARALIDDDHDLSRLSNTLAWASAEPEIGERGFPLIRLAGDIAASIADVRRIEFARQMESTLHTMLGRHDDAMRTARASLQSSLDGGNPDAIANAYFTLAVAHWARNEVQAAIDNFRRAVIGIEAMADPRHAIKALINATHLESARMHLSAALATADEVEQLSRKYSWPQGELDALLLQSLISDQTGNRFIGEEMARRSYALAIKLQRRSQIVLALIGLGFAAMDRGDPDEAIRIFSEVRDRSSYGPAGGIYLAMALEKKGRFAEATEIYEVVQGQEEDSGFATAAKIRLSNLALRASQPARALELARQASALVWKQGTSTSRSMVMPWDPKTAEGKALRALGRNADAAGSFQEAIDAIEVARGSLAFAESTHVDFYGGREEPYRQLIELMVLEGRNADALRLSDRLKASLLDEVSDAQRINLASLLTDEERETQSQIEDDITRSNLALLHSRPDPETARTLKAALGDARARWEQLQTTLYVRHGLRRAPRPADPLESPENLLPTPEDVILDFVVGEEKSILFVLSRRRGEAATIETHTIARDAAGLQRDVDRFLNRLEAANFDYEGDARALFRLLIAPAAKSLKGKKVVAVIGDGPLWRLPFQVLQTDSGEPLIRDLTLFTAPSLTSLQRAPRARTGRRPGVLAIGNPRFAGNVAAVVQARTRATLGDLPDAAVEARAVATLYDRERSRLLIGHQATESAVKEAAARYDVLHVAAHAVTDDRQPLYSSIVLAREDSHGQDGLLEGREITRLGLNARLAVLSACSTAEGNVRPGEGLIGLSWAFLVAGCPTIVATQWRIPSESTSRLMVDFHRELARGDISVAEALRQAQLRMMKDPRYRHPFYWSAFVVIGAGRS